MARKRSERPDPEDLARVPDEVRVDNLSVDVEAGAVGTNGDLPQGNGEEGSTRSALDADVTSIGGDLDAGPLDVEPADPVLDVEPIGVEVAPLVAEEEVDDLETEAEPIVMGEMGEPDREAGAEPALIPPPLEPVAPARGRAFWWSFLGGVITAAVVFAALYILNGTLSFTRGPQMVDLQTRTSNLQVRTQDMEAQLDRLGTRLDATESELATLEALSGQVDAMRAEAARLQTEIGGLRQDRDALKAEIATLEAARAEAEDRVRAVEEGMASVDNVFVGLRDLLLEAKPLPEGAAGAPPASGITPSDKSEPEGEKPPEPSTAEGGAVAPAVEAEQPPAAATEPAPAPGEATEGEQVAPPAAEGTPAVETEAAPAIETTPAAATAVPQETPAPTSAP